MQIETKRLILRPWKTIDANRLAEIANDKTIARFTSVPFPYDLDDAKKFIAESRKKLRAGAEFPLAVELKEKNKVIGSIAFIRINKKHKFGEIGYWTAKSFRRKRLTSEALNALIDHAFKNMDLNRIEIKCYEKNTASQKLIEKTGFKFEGKLRKAAYAQKKFHNILLYAMLKKEFFKKSEK